jgi:hypothetical protein
MLIRSILGVVAILPLPLAACGSASGGGAGGAPGTTVTVCTGLPTQTYADGLSATSMDGSVTMSFASASPAPPAEGLNAWTVKLTTASGAPITGATIALKPFMPQHGHGASVIPTITPMTTEGMFQVDDIDFFMPGIWTNTFTITPTSGPAETVVFAFCVQG